MPLHNAWESEAGRNRLERRRNGYSLDGRAQYFGENRQESGQAFEGLLLDGSCDRLRRAFTESRHLGGLRAKHRCRAEGKTFKLHWESLLRPPQCSDFAPCFSRVA